MSFHSQHLSSQGLEEAMNVQNSKDDYLFAHSNYIFQKLKPTPHSIEPSLPPALAVKIS